MDVKLFADKFSAFDVEPQKFLQRRPSEQHKEGDRTSPRAEERLHYNWLVRRALYRWRKDERDSCLQERLRRTYRPDAEKKICGDAYRKHAKHYGKTDLSSSVEVVPIRRCEENKPLVPTVFLTSRRQQRPSRRPSSVSSVSVGGRRLLATAAVSLVCGGTCAAATRHPRSRFPGALRPRGGA